MRLKSLRLGFSIKVGRKEETFLSNKDYEMDLDPATGIINIRHRIFKDDNAATSWHNSAFWEYESFPHSIFDKTPPAQRAKGVASVELRA